MALSRTICQSVCMSFTNIKSNTEDGAIALLLSCSEWFTVTNADEVLLTILMDFNKKIVSNCHFFDFFSRFMFIFILLVCKMKLLYTMTIILNLFCQLFELQNFRAEYVNKSTAVNSTV